MIRLSFLRAPRDYEVNSLVVLQLGIQNKKCTKKVGNLHLPSKFDMFPPSKEYIWFGLSPCVTFTSKIRFWVGNPYKPSPLWLGHTLRKTITYPTFGKGKSSTPILVLGHGKFPNLKFLKKPREFDTKNRRVKATKDLPQRKNPTFFWTETGPAFIHGESLMEVPTWRMGSQDGLWIRCLGFSNKPWIKP